MRNKIFTLYVMLLSVWSLMAQTPVSMRGDTLRYRSQNMRSAVKFLKLDEQISKVGPGVSTFSYKGKKVYVYVGEKNEVCNIGISLFPKEMKQLQPSPIYNYLEYAMLDNIFAISENPLTYRDLKFVKGKWSDLLNVNSVTDISVNNVDGRKYRVKWVNGGQTLAEIVFPILYETISNSTHKELESNFLRDMKELQSAGVQLEASSRQSVDKMERRFTNGKETVYVSECDTYLRDDITSCTYYIVGANGKCKLINDKRYPAESICNKLLTGQGGKKNVEITVKKQDFSKEQAIIGSEILTHYLRKQGCKIYFGLNKQNSDIIEFSLYADNPQLGYSHLFVMSCSAKEALNPNESIKCEAYLYIPMSNIQNLYADK